MQSLPIYPAGLVLDAAGNLFATAPVLGAVYEIPASSGYGTTALVATGFMTPSAMAADPAGNLYVGDVGTSSLSELPAASSHATAQRLIQSYGAAFDVAFDPQGNLFALNAGLVEGLASTGDTTIDPIGAGFAVSNTLQYGNGGLAIDGQGNIYVADGGNNVVKEFTAADGYAAARTICSVTAPLRIAVDAQGNLFVAQTFATSEAEGVIEIPAVGGCSAQTRIGSGFTDPIAVAVDQSGNVYVGVIGAIFEISAADQFKTTTLVSGAVEQPSGLAVDAAGNVYVADSDTSRVMEILTTPSPLVAAVLPSSRAIAGNSSATVFATMINSGPDTLEHCRVAVQTNSVFLAYQTTDPATNQLVGTPDTPVSIAGNGGTQSFLLSFGQAPGFDEPAQALSFQCDGTAAGSTVQARSVIGVNTVGLVFSETPIADVVAVSATTSNDGTLGLSGGPASGAFSVATINLGSTEAITASVDTGTTAQPLALSICQTDPETSQCLSPAAATVTLSDTAGSTPTFAVFAAASGPIPFDPDSARIFVRFTDADGTDCGSTSVAVRTP